MLSNCTIIGLAITCSVPEKHIYGEKDTSFVQIIIEETSIKTKEKV